MEERKVTLKSIANRILYDKSCIKKYPQTKDMLSKRITKNEELLLKYAVEIDSVSDNQYIISCKFKDGIERYVTVSDGYPCWIFVPLAGKRFNSVDEAKKWFDEYKKYLIEEPYGYPDDVTDTIKIREIIFNMIDTIDISKQEEEK